MALGCSAVVGLIFFFLALLLLLLAPNMTWGERFALAAMAGGMPFAACLLLSYRDVFAFRRAKRNV